MTATRTPLRMTDDRRSPRFAQLCGGEARLATNGRGRPPLRLRPATAAEISGRPRLRTLAAFLGCDPRVVAEALVESVQRDPLLRLQRL